MVLGDLGADVIKVENPKGGDDTRAWGYVMRPFLVLEERGTVPASRPAREVGI